MPIWDRLGAASYSLYLVHTTVIDLAWHSQQKWNLPDSIIRVSAVVGSLGAAWLFYLVVENPSHKLASTIRRVKTD